MEQLTKDDCLKRAYYLGRIRQYRSQTRVLGHDVAMQIFTFKNIGDKWNGIVTYKEVGEAWYNGYDDRAIMLSLIDNLRYSNDSDYPITYYLSLEELVMSKAFENHEANLLRGGVFSENKELSKSEGYETKISEEDANHFRISCLFVEVGQALKKVARVSLDYTPFILQFDPPEWMKEQGKYIQYIKNFGFTLIS